MSDLKQDAFASTCERASYSSVVRKWQDARCASFIIPDARPVELNVVVPDVDTVVSVPDLDLNVSVPDPDAKHDIATVDVERAKLPFVEAGRLVGERHYGDWVVNSRKLKTPVVIDEDLHELSMLTSSGCILL